MGTTAKGIDEIEGDAVMEVLRGGDELLFVAINMKASGYSDKTCALTNQHWIFETHTVESTTITLPPDLIEAAGGADKTSSYFKVVEIEDGQKLSGSDISHADMSINGAQWTISDMKLKDKSPGVA